MQIDILSVCRKPPRWVVEQTADYRQRMPRDLSFEFTHIVPGRDGIPAEQRRQDEASRLLRRLPKDTYTVALDIRGKTFSSEGLAAWLGERRLAGRGLAFVIGGADGLDESMLRHVDLRWSLSTLTMPHLLVQVVLAEQLYRAEMILANHPYHRG